MNFNLNEKEIKRYNKFIKKHKKCDGILELIFSLTGIANAVSVSCTGCKKTKNITDYDSW